MSVPIARLYVIHGSHACRTAMLMLEHKGIAYRRVDLLRRSRDSSRSVSWSPTLLASR